MPKLKIFLGDLSYINPQNRFNLFVPLNIGYVAAYTKKLYAEDIEITLFKDPDLMLEQINIQKPDVLGLSFYYWNTDLNKAMTQKARDVLGEKLLVVWGGPSVDTEPAPQSRLFDRFPHVDAFIANEGELGFAALIGERLSNDKKNMWQAPIDGVVFHQCGELVRGTAVGLSLDLAELNSPYLTGLMDPFIGGDYLAELQTSRLCPYTCTFCVSGKNRGKLRAFPYQQVIDEIAFIVDHYKDKPYLPMHLVDENFGIIERDGELSDVILESSRTQGYPKGIYFYNDKRFGDTAKKVIGNLGNMTLYGMALSLQTENPDTLKEIKRRNLTSEQLDEAIQWASSKGLNSTTELIFGLPYETRDSFIQLLNNALDRGFDSININNLIMLDGVEMARDGYREKHDVQSRFRLINANQGFLDDVFCVELDEVVVSTNCFSFDDFKFMRRLNFMFYAIFSLGFYTWFFQFVRHSSIPLVEFIGHLFSTKSPNSSIANWTNFVEKFETAALAELHNSPEAARQAAYKSFCENGNQVPPPTLLNVSFGAKLICLDKDWIASALVDSLENFIDRMENPSLFETANTLINLCHQERINLKDRKIPSAIICDYDLPSWKKDKFRRSLEHYKTAPKALKFSEDPEFVAKFPEFLKSFSEHHTTELYFQALQFMVPRSHLKYNLSFDTD
ncbi:MAG: radical SAM protein [Rhodospirillaceae bacterium]|nr:radical SAM protein [Rhodospirillaceae bacterium]